MTFEHPGHAGNVIQDPNHPIRIFQEWRSGRGLSCPLWASRGSRWAPSCASPATTSRPQSAGGLCSTFTVSSNRNKYFGPFLWLSISKKHVYVLILPLSQAKGLGPQPACGRPPRPWRHHRVRHRGVPQSDHLLAEDTGRQGENHHEWVRR